MLPGVIQYLLCLVAFSSARKVDAPRPTIRVEIHADADLDSLPRHLTLARACREFGAAQPGMSTRDCPRIEREFRGNAIEIENVEPGVYLMGLKIGRYRRVDLVSLGTADRTETVEFIRPRLRGRVTRQGTGAAATLEFSVEQDPVADDSFASDPATVDSDTSGEYETRLWAGGLYLARVTPKDGNGVLATFRFVAPMTDDSRDFVLSAHPLHVRVRDADSGQPIEGAKLVFIDPAGVQAPRSDASGAIDIPSVAAGAFHGTVVAKGYVNTVVDEVIEDREDSPPLEIAMKPRSGGNGFPVYSPDGSPARNAHASYRVNVVTDSSVMIPCDGDGICDPGERLADGEWVVVQQEGAGLTLRRAAEIYASRSVVLEPAGGPLIINLKPDHPAPNVCQSAFVSIGGVPVERWPSFTCAGRWPIKMGGLPSGPIEVTIVSLRIDDQGRRIQAPIAGPMTVQMPSGPVEIPIP
jgi:hypothetical protein